MFSKENRLGAALALAGALLGILGTFLLFTGWYEPMMAAEAAAGRPDEEKIVRYIIPVLADIGLLAGVCWAVAGYGFLARLSWAWPLAVVANVLALQGSFFPNIPAASRGLPPVFGLVFLPNLLFYFLLLRGVGKLGWGRILFSLVSGMAFVLCFMNGVASTDRIMVIGSPLYVAVQRLNWLASLGWGVFTIALILKPVEWQRALGLGAGLLGAVVGFPLGVATTISFGHFSMFYVAPIFCSGLLVALLLPWGRRMLAG
ncbi:MAG: hypothetical protein PHS96_13775 [Anaerolineales bacterium]|nr:hypothetical protein [Anaerolineales bacterium]